MRTQTFNPQEKERLRELNRKHQKSFRLRHPEYRAYQTAAMKKHRAKKKLNGTVSEMSESA